MNEIEQRPNPLALTTWQDMEMMANQVAKSGMFGITNPAQAICMFAIAKSEGIDALSVLRKYHVIEGKPAMRADAMLAEFKKAGGGVIYHIRTDRIVAATYFEDRKKIDAEAEKRAVLRMEIYLTLLSDKLNPDERKEMYMRLTKLNKEGEQTIVRTYEDAEKKGIIQGKGGIKTNWLRYPKAMLTARCDTEGIRMIMPSIIAGIMETSEAQEVAESDYQETSVVVEKTPEEMRLEAEELVRKAKDLPQHMRSELLGKAAELRCDAEDIEAGITESDYCLKYAGGIYKGRPVSEVGLSDLSIILESLERRAAKSKDPSLYDYEIKKIQQEIDRRTSTTKETNEDQQ